MFLCLEQELPYNKPYRLLSPYSREDIRSPCILFWYKHHPIHEGGEGITFAKHKLTLLEHGITLSGMDIYPWINYEDMSLQENIFATIPNDLWVYHILCFLSENDILSFSNTCKFARVVCLDDLVWKMLSFRTFRDPNIVAVNLKRSLYWRQKCLRGKPFDDMIMRSYWRLIFIVLYQLERTQSVVHSTALHSRLRFSECLGSMSEGAFRSSKGMIVLKGIKIVSCVEFVVYGFYMRAWHRKNFRNILPVDTEVVFKKFGILMSKSLYNFGGMRKQGNILSTDIGEKILPVDMKQCLSFKAYKFNGSTLLLCQNFSYDGTKYSDQFWFFDIRLLPESKIVA